MCRKFAFCAFALVIVVMSAPALAVNAKSTYQPNVYPGDQLIVKVDIDAQGNTGPNETQAGWDAWEMPVEYGSFGPALKNFGYGSGKPIVELDGVTKTGGSGNLGGSRDRSDDYIQAGFANDFSEMLTDLVYVAHTASGMGKDYIDLTIRMGADYADYNVDVTLWGWDMAFWGTGLPGIYPAVFEPEGSKRIAWSTTNPSEWLTNHGYDPNGYGYPAGPYVPGVTESNMPDGLMALVGDITIEHGTAPWLTKFDGATGTTFASTVNVTLDSQGKVTLYGWADMLSGIGSQHVVLNGFAVSLPEPASIALLGLGGFALLRKRRV